MRQDARTADSPPAGSDLAIRLERESIFLTVYETAALLRTTSKAVYALVERQQIPGVTRIGRRVLIRSDELLDWLRQKSECHR